MSAVILLIAFLVSVFALIEIAPDPDLLTKQQRLKIIGLFGLNFAGFIGAFVAGIWS